MPAWPIQGRSQVRHGSIVQTMQKGNCQAYGFIILVFIQPQQFLKGERRTTCLICPARRGRAGLDSFRCECKINLVLCARHFILIYIIYFKESGVPMEDQKSRMLVPQGEPQSSDSIPSFLLKTYEILENDKFADIICWTKNGEGFIVKKVKEFSQNVLPIYFRHSNYTSFVRQLNMYDFHKTRQENHENAFKNLMFKKGYKNMLKDIQRKDYKKNKENGKEGTSNDKVLEKSSSFARNERQFDLIRDQGKQTLKKITEISVSLQKKALALAELKQIPESQAELLKLVDILFDAKKLHRDLVDKMQRLNVEPEPEKRSFPCVQLKFERTADRFGSADYLHLESKEKMTAAKEEHIATNVSLFSSFNQI